MRRGLRPGRRGASIRPGPARRTDMGAILLESLREAWRSLVEGLRLLRTRGPSKLQFWFIALCIGVAAGVAALLFRMAIERLQAALYGVGDITRLHSEAAGIEWYWIWAMPVAGGLVVGLLLHVFTPDGRVRNVAEVIEGAALQNGRVEVRR